MTIGKSIRALTTRLKYIEEQLVLLRESNPASGAIGYYTAESAALRTAIRSMQVLYSYGFVRVSADGPHTVGQDKYLTRSRTTNDYYPKYKKWKKEIVDAEANPVREAKACPDPAEAGAGSEEATDPRSCGPAEGLGEAPSPEA